MTPPSYPADLSDSEPDLQLLEGGAMVHWSAEEGWVSVLYHDHAFGKGSRTGTNGEPRAIQEAVKVAESVR